MDRIVRLILDRKKQEEAFFENKFEFRPVRGALNSRISYVDGGSLDIVLAPSFALFFNRIYCCTYEGEHRVENKGYEFYSFITLEGQGIYRAQLIHTRKEIDFPDMLIKDLKGEDTFSAIGNMVRRFAELKVSKDQDNPTVIDGSLDPVFPGEKEMIESLDNTYGLSKTSRLTAGSRTLFSGLQRHAPKGCWLCRIGKGVYAVKLHPASRYIFRLDAKDKEVEIARSVLVNCKDPVFLGYPYGLVEADRFARISKEERVQLRLKLMTLLREQAGELEPYMNTMNAHDVLDSIS